MIASNRSYESVSNATKRGFLLPVVDEHGRPWTAWRRVGILAAWLAIGAWAYVMLAVLS